MAIITLARHIDYTADGLEVYADLSRSHCIDGGLEGTIHGARHIDYTSSGFELWETSLRCCDKVDNCPRALEELLPEADPPGIAIRLVGYAFQVENCRLAEGQIIEFVYCGESAGGEGDCTYEECGGAPAYDPPELCPCAGEKWVSEITLRGCTLALELCFTPSGSGGAIAATLCWYGEGSEGTDQGTQTVQVDCANPLHLQFSLISLPNCCDCLGTIDAATIDLRISGNCHPVVLARHIDYTADGKEIYMAELCFAGQGVESLCVPHCQLIAEVLEPTEGCVCAHVEASDNTYVLEYIGSNDWELNGGFLRYCAAPATATLHCEPNEDGETVTLTLDIICGTDNLGTADPIVIPKEDLENLDVTFEVTMTDPTAGDCTGLCNYEWNEMTATWNYLDDDCSSEDCDDCPNGPDDSSPGSSNGQIRSQACTGSTEPDCCIGSFPVRITR